MRRGGRRGVYHNFKRSNFEGIGFPRTFYTFAGVDLRSQYRSLWSSLPRLQFSELLQRFSHPSTHLRHSRPRLSAKVFDQVAESFARRPIGSPSNDAADWEVDI